MHVYVRSWLDSLLGKRTRTLLRLKLEDTVLIGLWMEMEAVQTQPWFNDCLRVCTWQCTEMLLVQFQFGVFMVAGGPCRNLLPT